MPKTNFTITSLSAEDYSMSEAVTVLESIRQLTHSCHTGDDVRDNKNVLTAINQMSVLYNDMIEDPSVELRIFKSPDWTWNSLCGREFWGTVDVDGNLLHTKMIAMN